MEITPNIPSSVPPENTTFLSPERSHRKWILVAFFIATVLVSGIFFLIQKNYPAIEETQEVSPSVFQEQQTYAPRRVGGAECPQQESGPGEAQYVLIDDAVCFGSQIIPEADPATFVVLGAFFDVAKDANLVYVQGRRVPLTGIDVNSFERVSDPVYRDVGHIYVLSGDGSNVSLILAENVLAPSSFDEVGDGYYRDERHVYYYKTGSLEWGFSVLPDADPVTFQIVSKETSCGNVSGLSAVGKDARGVYWGDTLLQQGVFDAPTFKLLNERFVKDANLVYQFSTGAFITEADAPSFESFPGCQYQKDAYRVYFQGVPVAGADPVTFTVLVRPYAKDARAVYKEGKELQNGADPVSFKTFDYAYSADANHVYYFDDAIEGADPVTFVGFPATEEWRGRSAEWSFGELDWGQNIVPSTLFAKDSKHVYFRGKILENTTPSTFDLMTYDQRTLDYTGVNQ